MSMFKPAARGFLRRQAGAQGWHVSTKKREWQVAAVLLYGQLIKSYRRRKLARVERIMRWGTLDALNSKLQDQGWSGVLQTAFVERVNLTVRRGVGLRCKRRLNCRTGLPGGAPASAYHFVMPHEA